MKGGREEVGKEGGRGDGGRRGEEPGRGKGEVLYYHVNYLPKWSSAYIYPSPPTPSQGSVTLPHTPSYSPGMLLTLRRWFHDPCA